MSQSRINQDTEVYRHHIDQSVGPGYYHLEVPPVACDDCYPQAPQVRLQLSGDSRVHRDQLMDVSSDLLGITRKLSKDPNTMYKPTDPKPTLLHFKDCSGVPPEDTRLSNPPCTLRGTGINRWEWLCQDPQEHLEMPFEHNISNRLLAKDHHRPIIPELREDEALPQGGELECEHISGDVCANPTHPSSRAWSCKETED